MSKSRRKLWSQGAMEGAVLSVQRDEMGLREASRHYNVPVETLRRRVHGHVSVSSRPGPPTVLTFSEEEYLVNYVIKMAEIGYGLCRNEVMQVAFKIAERSGRKHPFQEGAAGRSWFDCFRSRHPSLTLRTPQPLSLARAASSNEAVMSDFYAKLASLYARLNILSKPMNIFNCDETNITVVHKPGKVVAEMGSKNVWSITSSERGKTHTVLVCVSATGTYIPPFLIYPRKRMSEHLKVGCVPGTKFGCTSNGWITQDLFTEWFSFFLSSIPPIRPVLLLMDGHATHINIDVIDLARENDVHLLCLPSHTTHLLQPLDVGVFKSLKNAYSKVCKKYLASNPGRVITTDIIASLLGQAWPESVTPVNIMGGFHKCGIFPLNPGAVSDRQLATSTVTTNKVQENESGDGVACASSHSSQHINSSDFESLSSTELKFSQEQEDDFKQKLEEGYNVYNPPYIQWLKLYHPDALTALYPSFVSPDTSPTTSDTVLREILQLPKPVPRPKSNRRPALNAKATCITEMEVMSQLKANEQRKVDLAKEKELKQLEREKKAIAKQRKNEEKEARKSTKEKKSGRKGNRIEGDDVERLMANMSIESEVLCMKCGAMYGLDNKVWMGCDGCNGWIHITCSHLDSENLPDNYYCENCELALDL